MMEQRASLPWYATMIIKLILARLPVDYRLWRGAGIFRHGDMDRPDYAYRVFRTHYDRVAFPRKGNGFVALELGPGDSLFSAMISWSLNASRTHLVDMGRFARDDLDGFRRMADFLAQRNLPAPPVAGAFSVPDLLQGMNTHYGVEGMASLRAVADGSVDFIWSQAVLEHVYRDELPGLLDELRRIVRPDGACSHRIDLKDHLGGGLNNLRFSSSLWETEWIRRSGFYTNRIRFSEMLRLFEKAGFAVRVIRADRWPAPPLSRTRLSGEFAETPVDDLLVSGFDVVLTPR